MISGLAYRLNQTTKGRVMTDEKENAQYKKFKEMKFEDLVERLEEIVSLLEEGQLELEKSIALYEEGVQISKACEEVLHRAEKKVEKLVDLGSELKRVPFNPEKSE